MKEKQGIRWSPSGGISEKREGAVTSIVAEAIRGAVCVMIFLFATRIMLDDVFLWGRFQIATGVWVSVAALIVSLFMELSYHGSVKRGRVIRGCILGLVLVGFIWYLLFEKNREIIWTGIQEVLYQYIGLWDVYYGMSSDLASGMTVNVPKALDFALLLLMFLSFWAAKAWKKNLILAVLPGLVFVLELLVGYSPQLGALFLFVTGILLTNVSRWKMPEFRKLSGKEKSGGKTHSFSWIALMMVIVLTGGLLTSLTSPYAETIINNSNLIRATVQKWIGEPKGQGSIGHGNRPNNGEDSEEEWLSNESPVFEHVPVITVSLDEFPLGNIYLKGFYSGNYDDGRWDANVETFEEYFREKGYEPIEVTREIANQELNALLKTYGVFTLAQSAFNKRMDITYLAEQTGRMPVPYFAEFASSELIEPVGETYYTRTGRVSSLSATIWYYENQYVDRLDMFENEDNPLIGIGYDEYVHQYYLDVPEGMDTVSTLADSLYSDEIMPRISSENEVRLHKADLVAQWMEENTTYSLELPELPWRTDPIEYFLGESKTGYCMHYASASVMLLREMGVPARLATGYVVHKGDFAKVDRGYRATVLDDQAHAWVEIYLDGLGWFPVEVTKGYRNSDQDIEPDGETTGEDTTEAPESTTDDVTQSTDEQPDKNTEEDDTGEQSTTQAGGGDHTGRIDMKKLMRVVRIALTVISAVLIVMAGIAVVLKLRRNFREELRKMIRRRRMSLAIQTMNRRVYRKLRLTGKILKINLRDNGYAEILKKSYPDISEEDWEKYMEIVKAAAFSKREFSDEEVNFCYEVYRRIIRNG